MSARLPHTEHTARPWRIHELTPGFRVEDVWRYRTPGAGPGDFPVVLDALEALGGPGKSGRAVRLLFALRWKLGALLGWDDPKTSLSARVRSLREDLPPDIPAAAAGTPVPGTPFTRLYVLDDEYAMELANKTVHAVCHLGWVPSGDGGYELRMAALVKPNGMFGRLYMAFIKPFRYLIVYPEMTRRWERAWRERDRLAPRTTPRT
ncbi:DUF2867 domain-containing protein [Actinomadura macrotermitis]|uniref:DUF2867 domain-containing protein n=1 Tax=Actinomadura macrotermitis TaxID=2585200 RepID=A0A7K0BZG4_9ACTN|nr:DUF2867 domain-containing protein [Actinomadura macrotermitis]MQY06570.1 hypothetical protein [Actinomadura macrotermitis]